MRRQSIVAAPDRDGLNTEIARLRGLDADGLRQRWLAVFGKPAPTHLAGHFLFRMLAYQLQADSIGDLDAVSRAVLDRTSSDGAEVAPHHTSAVRSGTVLGREWNGRMERVMVLSDGFAWNGTTYQSLSKVAFAITGTRWNGPRFFGLRDKRS